MKNVTFSAQNRTLVRDITCQFDDGKTTALVGPSGCGKSTVLKLAAGLIVPSKGRVFFRDKDITRMNKSENLAFRKEGSVVFQDSALWANQNLYQILELPLRVHFPFMTNAEREKRIREVAYEVGYKKDLAIRPAALSMGEQKLIAFARAMVCSPKLLFLDEWTESLDDNAANRLIGIVKNMKKKGMSVILISHDIRIIRDLADIVIIIVGGQLLLELTKEQITCDEDISRYLDGENAA